MIITKQNNNMQIGFGEYCKIKASHLHQHDKGQIIQFLDIPDGTQVEFSNENHARAEPYIVRNSQVAIPDFLLEENAEIVAYVKVVDENSETTVKTITIPVKSRPPADDGVPPENQQSFKQQIEEIMQSTKEIAQNALDKSTNVEQRADNGDFNGKNYVMTQEGKKEIETYINNAINEAVLDAIGGAY